MDVVTGSDQRDQELLTRARNLFAFLTESQRLRSKAVPTTDSYESVHFLADLPEHECIQRHTIDDASEPDAPVFSITRPDRRDPPEPDPDLLHWISTRWAESSVEPELLDVPLLSELADDPDHQQDDVVEQRRANFTHWLGHWRAWAIVDRAALAAQRVYEDLFSNADQARSHAETFEVVLGVACLAWEQPGGARIRRHLFTSAAVIEMDEDTGRLDVKPHAGRPGLVAEVDMIDPSALPSSFRPVDLQEQVSSYAHHVADPVQVGELARGVVHGLHPSARYTDSEAKPGWAADPSVTFAPAVILRRRSAEGLVRVFQTISSQLDEADSVPEGLLPLVDPDHALPATPDQTPGGIVRLDEEPFLALPVNDKQLRILDNVDRHRQTLVQGPPGTGKTHTAAALLTHLLAQGKRVLVTAQTDRALKEVRAKLPADVQALSVAIVGQSRAETADLKTAVERLSAKFEDHDPRHARHEMDRDLAKLDELRRERSELVRRLIDARCTDVTQHAHAGYHGTLASLARQVHAEESHHKWLLEHVRPTSGSQPPVGPEELREWLQLLNDPVVMEGTAEADQSLLALSRIPTPDQFAQECAKEEQANTSTAAFARLRDHHATSAVRSLNRGRRRELQDTLRDVARRAHDLEQRGDPWINSALSDIRSGREATWQGRSEQLTNLVEAARVPIQGLAATTRVTAQAPEIAPLVLMATAVLGHLKHGNAIKTTSGGSPKVGLLTPRSVKDAAPLFAGVRVDGLPPTTEPQLKSFLHWAEARRILDALDEAWPADVIIPEEDTLQERLQWHRSELNMLERLLAFAKDLRVTERRLGQAGLPQPDWSDLADIEDMAALTDAIDAEDRRTFQTEQLDTVAGSVRRHLVTDGTYRAGELLHAAIVDRDLGAYSAAHDQLDRLHRIRAQRDRLRQLEPSVSALSPSLRDAVRADPANPQWRQRLRELPQAWAWAATGSWISGQGLEDTNAVQQRLHINEETIHTVVGRLSATRAWSHALAPVRLTGRARADLYQYVQLVKRLGKGTGKYAAQQRQEIQAAMANCADAVPVWIMPLYRIAEQLKVHEDMFDVVIVDEASQAGLESIFLQYLAPKIVVIGDDKQVSPSAVGVNQQQLRDLADHYLVGDRYKSSWHDPKRSLFDEAKMRYGGTITLTEHRRCVPEIINFSNKIAYEPEGIRLTPVRQFGSDRLTPIQPVHVVDGYERGTTNKVNPPEAEQIVDQIQKCFTDPRYDGLTVGVISLQGTKQAKLIESMLLTAIDPEEWAARDLRCGDAASFQGSERDVIFLSMVAAPTEGRRLGQLTRDEFVQRYNVAVSRAKDQLWLFHTVTLDDCPNPEDMRFQLLDYCYAMSRKTPDGHAVTSLAVSEDVLVDPFDSLFEQRVHNRLVERGYTVLPQYEVQGYRIDLVVMGAKSKLAIECDGDHWHGPDRYAADLARQRDLERAGWTFFRIRESSYYLDQAKTLSGLWAELEQREIFASGRRGVAVDAPDSHEPEGTATPSSATPRRAAPGANNDSVPVARNSPARALTEAADATQELAADEESAGNEAAPADLEPDRESEDPEEVIDEESTQSKNDVTFDDLFAMLDEIESLSADGELQPYASFSGGNLPHPTESSSDDVVFAVLSIVEVEGPVTGERIVAAYLRNSEASRAGRRIKDAISQALGRALKQGLVVADTSVGLLLGRTYRLPEHPTVLVRQLGARSFQEVPISELSELLRVTYAEQGDEPATVYRTVLHKLGLKRLTADAMARINRAARQLG